MTHSEEYLFVYGSLKRNGSAYHLLEKDSQFEGETKIRGAVIMYQGYPALIEDEGGWVSGEIFRVSKNDLWHKLDEYEGPHYVRKIIQVLLGGKKLPAQAYFFNKTSQTSSIKF